MIWKKTLMTQIIKRIRTKIKTTLTVDFRLLFHIVNDDDDNDDVNDYDDDPPCNSNITVNPINKLNQQSVHWFTSS